MQKIIEKMVAKALEREHRERKVGEYYASELPYCVRKVWYRYKKPKEFSTSTLMVFEAGTIIHNWFADMFKASGMVEKAKAEGRVREYHDGFEIHGRFDNLIVLQSEGDRVLLEIKTVRNKRYIVAPKSHHVMQLMFYMKELKLKSGYLLYVDKRDLSFKVFKVDFDQKLADKISNKAKLLHDALILGNLPPKEAKMTVGMNWECSYCEYKRECTFDESGDKDKKSSVVQSKKEQGPKKIAQEA